MNDQCSTFPGLSVSDADRLPARHGHVGAQDNRGQGGRSRLTSARVLRRPGRLCPVAMLSYSNRRWLCFASRKWQRGGLRRCTGWERVKYAGSPVGGFVPSGKSRRPFSGWWRGAALARPCRGKPTLVEDTADASRPVVNHRYSHSGPSWWGRVERSMTRPQSSLLRASSPSWLPPVPLAGLCKLILAAR